MNAVDVALCFLAKTVKDATKEECEMSKSVLQAMLFFAQEEYLYKTNKPLFKEDIVAWRSGPVVYAVWLHFDHAEQETMINLSLQDQTLHKLTQEQQEVIDFVWNKYGNKEESALENITHSYQIWQDHFNGHDSGKNIISKEEIYDYKVEQEEAIKEAKQQMREGAAILGF